MSHATIWIKRRLSGSLWRRYPIGGRRVSRSSTARGRAFHPIVEFLEARDCPSSIAFSTYLGGSGFDGLGGTGIGVDAVGDTYVVGYTRSTNFPSTAGSFQPSFSGNTDGFVAKFNANGGLAWATYLGGSSGDTNCTAVAVDASGNVYVTGYTQSANFPTTPGALEATYPGANAAFVAELNANGSALVYSTFLGGAGGAGRAIAVDSAGNTYVADESSASNNATTPGAFQSADPDGSIGTYIAKLNPGGTALIYATYLGGSTFDVPRGIALDASGNLYVDGDTRSSNFPTTPGAFQTMNRGGANPGDGSSPWDAFVTKLNATGTALIYSTYLGGSGFEAIGGIAVDSAGSAYVTGLTYSTDFPTANALQPTPPGTFGNAFVTKLNPTGTALVYSTYLGGSGTDNNSNAIAVDSAGDAYVSGNTNSADFPTANPVQAHNAGGEDAFVTKLSPAGTTLLFSSYLGGSGVDGAQAIATDGSGNIYVAGHTESADFPTANPFQSANAGGQDAFVAKVRLSAQEQTALLIDQVNNLVSGGVLSSGNGNALKAKLNAAIADLNAGDITLGVSELNAFINQVNALEKSGKLTASQAQALIDAANQAIASAQA